jgi:hypothetical protein
MPRQPLPVGTWGRIRTHVDKTDAKYEVLATVLEQEGIEKSAHETMQGRSTSCRCTRQRHQPQPASPDPRTPLPSRRGPALPRHHRRLHPRPERPRRAPSLSAYAPWYKALKTRLTADEQDGRGGERGAEPPVDPDLQPGLSFGRTQLRLRQSFACGKEVVLGRGQCGRRTFAPIQGLARRTPR